jgi:hypothetical protein
MLAPLMEAFKTAIEDARKAVVAQDKDKALDALRRLEAMLSMLHQQLASHLGDTLLGVITKDILGGIWNAITKSAAAKGVAAPIACTHPAANWRLKDGKILCIDCDSEITQGKDNRWYRKP